MTRATEILDMLDDAAVKQADVSVDRINNQVGHRGTGALVMIPAALELTPVGAIPGVPTVLALIIAVFAVQILFAREDMWLPGFLGHRSVSAKKLAKAVEWLRPAARWSDRHLGSHLLFLVDDPAPRFVAVAILALCCTVPVLELIPFASSIPAATIALFGLALLTRDGRVMALSWAAFLLAVWGVWTFWPL